MVTLTEGLPLSGEGWILGDKAMPWKGTPMSSPSRPDLSWWRDDRQRWDALAFVEAPDEPTLDAHADERAAVLEQLLRDGEDSDADFLVYLLDQETQRHRSGWSLSEALRIAALLVAERMRLEDVFALWAAKNANFDTMFGLDSELLFGGGVEPTVTYVETADDPARDSVLRYISGTTLPTDSEVRRRMAGLREYHSA